jgi:hypothetical protein
LRSTALRPPTSSSPHVVNYFVEVFQYASKHGYRTLMNDAAQIAFQQNIGITKIPTCATAHLQSAWIRVFPLHCELRTNFFFVDAVSVQTIGMICLLIADEPSPVLHPSLVEPRIAPSDGNFRMLLPPK